MGSPTEIFPESMLPIKTFVRIAAGEVGRLLEQVLVALAFFEALSDTAPVE